MKRIFLSLVLCGCGADALQADPEGFGSTEGALIPCADVAPLPSFAVAANLPAAPPVFTRLAEYGGPRLTGRGTVTVTAVENGVSRVNWTSEACVFPAGSFALSAQPPAAVRATPAGDRLAIDVSAFGGAWSVTFGP